MRWLRLLSMGAVVLVVSVLPAGCGVVAGFGLTAVGRAVTRPIPSPGACYDVTHVELYGQWATRTPAVRCSEPHVVETFHVATATARPDARPPLAGSPLADELMAACESAATGFLGDDWVNGRVRISMTLPRPDDWVAGVRQYSCDAAEVSTPSGYRTVGTGAVRRSGSLRGALTGAAPVALRCFAVGSSGPTPDDWTTIDCARPHGAEYAGPYRYTVEPASDEAAFEECWQVVRRYLGISGPQRVAWWYMAVFTETDALRCYVAAPDGKQLVGSVKGIGNRAPKLVKE